MTVLVGILCSDGVVIASDSAATFGNGQTSTIGQQSTKKVHRLSERMIYAATGAVGMGQLVAERLRSGWSKNELSASNPDELMNKLAAAINGVVLPYLQSASLQRQLTGNADGSLCKSMVAMDCKGTPCLFTFDFNGAPERATKELPFVSLGSGQQIADPFLAFLRRVVWAEQQPPVAEGTLVAAWTIDHVCKTNPGGVGGAVQLMQLLKKPEVRELNDGELAEHRQQAAAAEKAMFDSLHQPAPASAEPMPLPPSNGVGPQSE